MVQGYIADVTAPEHRAGQIGRLGAAYDIGFIVGPFVGGVLARPRLGPLGFQIPLLVAAMLVRPGGHRHRPGGKESRVRNRVAGRAPNRG